MVQKVAIVLFLGLLYVTAIPFESIGFENYVVNGTDAREGEIPYIVSLRSNSRHICGGSILDESHILTACHCVYNSDPSRYTIQYGNIELDPNSPSAIQVAQIECHPNYVPGGLPLYINDVSVLTLAQPMVLNEFAKPIALPSQNAPTPGGRPALLSGWGLNATTGSIQTILQKVDLSCYTDDGCAAIHGSNVGSDYHVCGGVPEGGKGQCSGDSGGPLVVDGVQVGVVSWSVKPCTIAPYPGVYAKVSSYVGFLCRNANCVIRDV